MTELEYVSLCSQSILLRLPFLLFTGTKSFVLATNGYVVVRGDVNLFIGPMLMRVGGW
jgi:hypothetical protein